MLFGAGAGREDKMSITLRAYNVLFGDCLLVSWDEDDGEHHAWVDFGNFVNDPNAVFSTVYNDVLERTDGNLDLLVVTHRHMDHLEGFHSFRQSIAREFTIKKIWYAHVTPGLDDQFKATELQIRERGLLPEWVRMGEGVLGQIYRNNFGLKELSVEDRMDEFLEELRGTPSHAVFRGVNMANILPGGMRNLKVEILAPEKESSLYFEPLEQTLKMRQYLDDYFDQPSALAEPLDLESPFERPEDKDKEASPLDRLADFSRLRRKLQSGGLDLLRAVDKTRNNTSVVLALTYGEKQLLLAADAEEKSWELMQKEGASFDSALIKVAHHGSINASPSWSYDQVFPANRPSNGVIISTDPTRYTGENEVPKAEVVANWRRRVTNVAELFRRTDDVELGKYVEVRYV
jgi:hypothetical protein